MKQSTKTPNKTTTEIKIKQTKATNTHMNYAYLGPSLWVPPCTYYAFSLNLNNGPFNSIDKKEFFKRVDPFRFFYLNL